MADLVVPGAAAEPTLHPARAGALFAGDGYLAVDSGRAGADDAAADNAAALLAGLEHPTVDTAGGLALRLYRHVAAEELRPLRELLLGWAQRVVERRTGLDIGVDDMAQVERLNESGELEAYFEERRLAVVNRYREEGRLEARAEERARLRRLAEKRFGAEAAASLAAFLGERDDAARLAAAGDWIVECGKAAELLARLDAAGRTP